MERRKFKTVSEYISSFPPKQRKMLNELRHMVKELAPNADEVISYNMPAFKWNGLLVWYAGYDGHIGFYPTSSGIRTFADQLTKYKTSKGAIQFPVEKSIPVSLVKKIVRFR